MGFYVRLPDDKQGRTEFRIYEDGHPVRERRIDAINAKYRHCELDFEAAKEEIYKIKNELVQRAKSKRPTFPDKNLDILEKATTDYKERLDIKDKSRNVAIAGLRRCIDLLQQKILYSISIDELEKLVKKQKIEARPKLAVYFNVLLKHCNRTDRLIIPTPEDPDVKYLTLFEFQDVLKAIDNQYHLPLITAFSTGCRLGEVFGIQKIGRKSSVWVDRQMYERPDGNGHWYGVPKWKKKRWAPIIKWGKERVQEWINNLLRMSENEKIKLRKLDWFEIMREGCKETYPNLPHKHLNFRDIRHCYAIYWLDKGATLRHVSQSMGNSEKVVKKHYSGFLQTDEAEQVMLALDK